MNEIPHAINMAQQGDVQLMRVSKLPEGCRKRDGKDRLTIALSKISGHHHTFDDDGMTAVMDAPDGRVFIVKEAPATQAKPIRHQEHGPFTLEPGIWNYEPVQEKDWLADMVRPVVD